MLPWKAEDAKDKEVKALSEEIEMLNQQLSEMATVMSRMVPVTIPLLYTPWD